MAPKQVAKALVIMISVRLSRASCLTNWLTRPHASSLNSQKYCESDSRRMTKSRCRPTAVGPLPTSLWSAVKVPVPSDHIPTCAVPLDLRSRVYSSGSISVLPPFDSVQLRSRRVPRVLVYARKVPRDSRRIRLARCYRACRCGRTLGAPCNFAP
jgi:hypothetical protein